MKSQLVVVRVQHGQRAGCARQMFVVLFEGFDQGFVDHALIRPGQASQLRGQREGEQEVGGAHLGLELALQPQRALVVLAVWAGAVAAEVRPAALGVAARAGREHVRRKASAAGLESGQCLVVVGQPTYAA
jgi:hypothetical protein